MRNEKEERVYKSAEKGEIKMGVPKGFYWRRGRLGIIGTRA